MLGYTGYRERSDSPVRRLQPAATIVPLILSLGPSIAVDGERRASFVAGLYDGPAHTEFTGDQLGVQVDLTPLGARRLLGVPMADLARRTTPAGELLGEELSERLADTPGWSARFALLDDLLRRRLGGAPTVHPGVATAWSRLVETGGAISVERLARESGYSRRHLSDRFATDVGLGPKAIGRILRFERTCSLLRSGVELARAASAGAYADQPHLNREFRALTGRTPTSPDLLPNVQDARVGAA